MTLAAIAEAARKHRASCSCGAFMSSATREGLLILAEDHVVRNGVRHRVRITLGTRRGAA